MKIEYALHNAIPTLVVEQREDGNWHMAIEIDWADSYEGNVWPASVLAEDEDGKINGKFVDWVTARGAVGVLGAASCLAKFPERIEVGPVPECYVAAYAGDDGKLLAFAEAEKAADWSRGFDKVHPVSVTHCVPSKITPEQIEASTRRSVEEES